MSIGPVMLDIDDVALSPADRDLLREPAVGGVILFSRNYESPVQIADLVADARAGDPADNRMGRRNRGIQDRRQIDP